MFVIASFILSPPASAHVKWFAPYDVAQSPLPAGWLLSSDFVLLVCAAALALAAAVAVENTRSGRHLVHALNQATAEIDAEGERLMLAVYGAFFVSLWTAGGIILTPELATSSPMIGWFQLLVAAFLIWRPTLILTALGIVALYFYAISQYGLFHLLDYPVFLGAAAYFALTTLGWQTRLYRPLDVLRIATGITLMWASVEKWAYPDWTLPVFAEHPDMATVFEPMFFMKAAGVVEYTLGAALLATPLVRRAAAVMLAATFISAVMEFGKIDAIGPAPIIIVLILIAADTRPQRTWSPAAVPILYLAGLAATISAYYCGHQWLFRPDAAP